MWHKALQSACQKYLTDPDQKSEFALVIRALRHGARILLMWLSGALKPQPPAWGETMAEGRRRHRTRRVMSGVLASLWRGIQEIWLSQDHTEAQAQTSAPPSRSQKSKKSRKLGIWQ